MNLNSCLASIKLKLLILLQLIVFVCYFFADFLECHSPHLYGANFKFSCFRKIRHFLLEKGNYWRVVSSTLYYQLDQGRNRVSSSKYNTSMLNLTPFACCSQRTIFSRQNTILRTSVATKLNGRSILCSKMTSDLVQHKTDCM